jgi:hypothetical protein
VCVRRSTTGPVDAADRLGKELAAQLLEEGIADLIPARSVRDAGRDNSRAASPDPINIREGDT